MIQRRLRAAATGACFTALLSLTACAAVDSAERTTDETEAVVLTEAILEIRSTDGSTMRHTATSSIEALDVEGDHLFWVTDEEEFTLNIAQPGTGELVVAQLALPMETEGLCAGQIDETSFDLFLSDDDGVLMHAWLTLTPQPQVREVRRLSINPDTGVCDVSADRVLLLNGPLGIVSFSRNPETDPVIRTEYLWQPVGRGNIEPTDFRIESASQEPLSLLLWDDDYNPHLVALDQPERSGIAPHDTPRYVFTAPTRPSRETDVDLVTADMETLPVRSYGDAADDPAILVGTNGQVWIIGTDKQYGLDAYSLQGALLASVDRGRVNNVDALELSDNQFLVAGSNRTDITLDLYQADLERGELHFEAAFPLDMEDPYGLCMGRDSSGMKVFVGDTDGNVEVWEVDASFSAQLSFRLTFDSQTEGCVYDDRTNRLFVGEEALGIWSVDLASREKQLFASVETDRLVADVEGLDICRNDSGSWLLASSQGDDSYLAFDLSGAQQPVKFRVQADLSSGIDGVSETDGLACTRRALPGYPEGVLVLQDGRNRAPIETQNFKLIDWRKLPLPADD